MNDTERMKNAEWYRKAAEQKMRAKGFRGLSPEQIAARMESVSQLAAKAAALYREQAAVETASYGVQPGDEVAVDFEGVQIEGTVVGVDSRGISVQSEDAFFPFVQEVVQPELSSEKSPESG